MHDVHVATLIAVLVGVLMVLPRAIRGPTALDRILAVNVVGTKTIVILALLGFLGVEHGIAEGADASDYSRAGFFLDIALAYALINFIATLAVLRYIEIRADRQRVSGVLGTGVVAQCGQVSQALDRLQDVLQADGLLQDLVEGVVVVLPEHGLAGRQRADRDDLGVASPGPDAFGEGPTIEARHAQVGEHHLVDVGAEPGEGFVAVCGDVALEAERGQVVHQQLAIDRAVVGHEGAHRGCGRRLIRGLEGGEGLLERAVEVAAPDGDGDVGAGAGIEGAHDEDLLRTQAEFPPMATSDRLGKPVAALTTPILCTDNGSSTPRNKKAGLGGPAES